MKALRNHPWRIATRLLWLGAELALAAATYAGRCAFRRELAVSARASWLHVHSRRVLRIFRLEPRSAGNIPSRGLLVSNHLSYLDVLVFAALSPCVFVAKSDVRSWPVFGWFARLAGTIFVDRGRRVHAARSVNEIAAALESGALVMLFPEGTSSGGETVLPFKSSLLEAATRRSDSITAAAIDYELPDGDVSEEVCYWKDMTLVPHLINLLGRRSVGAAVRFTEYLNGNSSRKELARQLHAQVLRLKLESSADKKAGPPSERGGPAASSTLATVSAGYGSGR